MIKSIGILVGLSMLGSCYSVKKLENALPETSRDFPRNSSITFNDKDTTYNRTTYYDLAFQRNSRIIQGIDTLGPAKLNFYYDGERTLIVTPSDYPTKKVKDLIFKVKRNGHHLILQSKFNFIPLVPFVFLWQRQLMAMEMDDNGNLIIMSHSNIHFYAYLYITSQFITDERFGEYVLRPDQDPNLTN